jgi:hypothetical protein
LEKSLENRFENSFEKSKQRPARVAVQGKRPGAHAALLYRFFKLCVEIKFQFPGLRRFRKKSGTVFIQKSSLVLGRLEPLVRNDSRGGRSPGRFPRPAPCFAGGAKLFSLLLALSHSYFRSPKAISLPHSRI